VDVPMTVRVREGSASNVWVRTFSARFENYLTSQHVLVSDDGEAILLLPAVTGSNACRVVSRVNEAVTLSLGPNTREDF
jgi:hypothetical protein